MSPNDSLAKAPESGCCGAPARPAAASAAPLARAGRAVRAADRVVLVFAALIAGLFVFDAVQAVETLRFTADALWGIAPFLLISVILAAALKASGADDSIARVFSGHPVRAIFAAAAFGGLSPFCSCGVVPIVAALLAARVPLAPVMAFCLASPVMDPEMFVLMAAETGLSFTLAKTAAAVGIGLFGGLAVHALSGGGRFDDVLRPGMGGGCGTSSCTPDVLRRRDIVWTFWRDEARRGAFAKTAGQTAVFLGKWLALAFALESLMVAHVPADWIASTLGTGAWWTIPAAALAGVPAYLNGYAAIPLVASLMEMGMGQAAALTFMVAGGVTSAPAALAVFAVVRAPVFGLYLALALTGSVLVGVVYAAVL
jgi:uncharacterized membrane protein YraQ (UPF0718 family)